MAKFRILSLDGGGSWALLQVMALQKIYGEAARGCDILAGFDLVAANSGGAIALGGLARNLTLAALLKRFFLDEGLRRRIFTPISFGESARDMAFKLVGLAPRYQTDPKLAVLQESLQAAGACKLSELPARIARSAGRSPQFLIPAFDYDMKRAVYFRSNLKSRAASAGPHADPTLAEAIHASSTAPTRFFDRPAEFGGRRYWDGGVAGLNNPVLAAVVEALANGVAAAEVAVLSIGTGSVRLPLAGPGVKGDARLLQAPADGASVAGNLAELAGAIVDDPPDAASFESYVALGRPLPAPGGPRDPPFAPEAFVRLNPMVEPRLVGRVWRPPPGLDLKAFAAIAALEMDAVENEQVAMIRRLGRRWLADQIGNQAIRSNSQTFRCEIGHPTFSAAKAAWDALKA